jgi:hypothetical protein
MKDWANPKSDWILAGNGEAGWTEEFMGLVNLAEPHDSFNVLSIDVGISMGDTTISKEDWGCSYHDKNYYYSKDKNIMGVVPVEVVAKYGEDMFFDFFDKTIDECVSGGVIKTKSFRTPSELT